MKVTDLKEKDLILCTTVEECKAIQNILHEAGLKWHDGTSYKEVYRTTYIPKQYYCPFKGRFGWNDGFGLEDYNIFNASEFIDQVKIIVDSTTYKVKDGKYERTFIIDKNKKITALGNNGRAKYMEFCNSKPEVLVSFAKAAQSIADNVDKERTGKQI